MTGEAMGSLEGRVAIITGAGRGLGRAHALQFAAEGARVVVNDVADDAADPAAAVAAEIRAAGGEAIGLNSDAADWEAARSLVATAIEAYGGVDILVNNAGILRDRLIVNMTESEWDEVIRVHLRGHFCPTHHVAAYWRDEHKAGRAAPRNMINTSSTSGLLANPGQSNYGTAKSGIATFTQIVAKELSRFDVKVNCIAPVARTRLTLATPGLEEIMAARDGMFDEWDPGNVSPVVAYLASTACRFNGETFFVRGGTVQRVRSWELAESVRCERTWSVDELAEALDKL
jgi:NAD(P)-dependent dehydrogenase (short-subunit alcohol dehydrogenase family)